MKNKIVATTSQYNPKMSGRSDIGVLLATALTIGGGALYLLPPDENKTLGSATNYSLVITPDSSASISDFRVLLQNKGSIVSSYDLLQHIIDIIQIKRDLYPKNSNAYQIISTSNEYNQTININGHRLNEAFDYSTPTTLPINVIKYLEWGGAHKELQANADHIFYIKDENLQNKLSHNDRFGGTVEYSTNSIVLYKGQDWYSDFGLAATLAHESWHLSNDAKSHSTTYEDLEPKANQAEKRFLNELVQSNKLTPIVKSQIRTAIKNIN